MSSLGWRVAIVIVALALIGAGCAARGVQNGSEKLPALEQTAANARFGFSIKLPAAWSYEARSENGDGFYIDCLDGGVDMRAYGSYGASVLGMDYFLADLAERYDDVEKFVFADGYEGLCANGGGVVVFVRFGGDTTIEYYVDYNGSPEWFSQNKTLVYAVAATLAFDGEPTE